MTDLDELGKLREYLEDETVRHLIETERDRSAFDDPGCRCVLCVSRHGLLAMMQQVRRSVKAHATVAKLYGRATAERDAEVAARAWDEGHDAGWNSRDDDAARGWMPSGVHESDAENPYRKAVE